MSDWSDIGAELRRERESRGWSLRDVTHRTRIPTQTIEQLEANDYRKFPSPAYAKSFLAQYSKYLGVDADDWLEAFQTDTALSNLDSYDYLKDHDEHLGAAVVPLKSRIPKRSRPRKKAAPISAPSHSGSATALQPLVVFAITAILLTGGAFGYLHLSKKIAAQVPDKPAAEAPGFVDAPSMVHSRPAPTKPISNATGTPPTIASTGSTNSGRISPIGVATPVQPGGSPIVFDTPPPRAVIIEE